MSHEVLEEILKVIKSGRDVLEEILHVNQSARAVFQEMVEVIRTLPERHRPRPAPFEFGAAPTGEQLMPPDSRQ